MSSLQVAVAQFEASTDPANNRSIISNLISQSAKQSSLVVLPENSMYSDPGKTRPNESYSEPVEGDFVAALSAAAAKNSVHVLCGMTETNPLDAKRPFNTLVCLDQGGNLVGTYRKIHLYDAFGYKESDKITAADIANPLTFDIEGVRVGAATCYDLRFPEIFRWLTDAGSDLIALPAAWAAGPSKERHWDTLLRSRAIENTVYVAGSGQTGPSCAGQSMIIDPMGVTVASAGETANSIASGLVSLSRVEEVRATNPSLIGRRFGVSPIS